ncbi:MAG: general secretion pathway protein GspK, partial [Thermoguttaceae bacterium]|nr:general secretion pathway protein GspK [Thermoguttaceae bacterium]
MSNPPSPAVFRRPPVRFANRRNRSRRRGVVLLIVSLVVAMLTLGGATLLVLMRAERDATNVRGQDALVKSVDRSAVVFLLGALEKTREEREKLGGLYNNPSLFCAAPLLTASETGDVTSRFTVVSPKFEDSQIEGLRYGLVDESTRLNLAAVLEWDAESPGAGRTALMKLPGMTAVAADSILDWIDPDENARQNGGESRYYASQKLPYSPRNAVPVFLEEILLARGVARIQLYGADEDFTYGVGDGSANADSAPALGGSLLTSAARTNPGAASTAVPWKELLTVFSAEKDVDPSGEARVDLNCADLQFLYDELAPRVGEDVAKFAVLYRQYGPEEAPNAGANVGNSAPGQNRRNAQNRRTSGYFPSPNAQAAADDVPLGNLATVE